MPTRPPTAGLTPILLVLAGVTLTPPARSQSTGPQDGAPVDPPGTLIRRIDVTTRDVFSEEAADGNLFYWLANLLHHTTVPRVPRRELWFEEGDRVTDEEIAELERNLRALNLFGEVDARLEPVDEDVADLNIRTRDKFSLILAASVSSAGGVESFRGDIGESNLLGQGKRIRLTGSKDDQDESLLLRYDDPQLFGTWYRGAATVGDSTEGPVFAVSAVKPFRHLGDPLSHGASFSSVPTRADYYESGDRVAEVPLDTLAAGAFLARAVGPRSFRRSLGLDVAISDVRYQGARGPAAPTIRVPGDTTEVQAAVRGTLSWAPEFVKLQYLDTLDFVQDEQLGVSADLRMGAAWRDEEGAGSEVQPLIEGSVRAAARPLPETWITAEVRGASRFDGSGVVAWDGRFAFHAFQQSLPAQTLAFSVRHDAAEDDQGLPRQLTLGEDNGLRGYPAREFTGTRMTVVNVEDRIATGLEILSVHVGAVAFADFGWPGGEGPDAGELFRSAGVGLRFGSSNLFGANVFRMDFTWPLDEHDGEEFDFSVSFSAGQVFGFFGHATGLSDDVVGFR